MLLGEPDIVVLDDPSTGGVNEETRARLQRWFTEVLSASGPVLIITSRIHPDDLTGEAGDGRQA